MKTEPEQLRGSVPRLGPAPAPPRPRRGSSAQGGTQDFNRSRVGVIDSAVKNLQLSELSFQLLQPSITPRWVRAELLQRPTSMSGEARGTLRHRVDASEVSGDWFGVVSICLQKVVTKPLPGAQGARGGKSQKEKEKREQKGKGEKKGKKGKLKKSKRNTTRFQELEMLK